MVLTWLFHESIQKQENMINNKLLLFINICDVLSDLVYFVQIKKREKHPLRSATLQAEACNFTKSNTFPWVFLRFLNCTNGTKSRNASLKNYKMWVLWINNKLHISVKFLTFTKFFQNSTAKTILEDNVTALWFGRPKYICNHKII